MSHAIIIAAETVTTVAASTRYTGPGTTALRVDSNNEAIRASLYRLNSAMNDLYARISANGTTGSSTIRSRINSGNGNLLITIGSGATGEFEDVTNIDRITPGDKLNYEIVTAAGGTLTIEYISNHVVSMGGDITITRMFDGWDLFHNATDFQFIGGSAAFTTTEANVKFRCKMIGEFRNLFENVGSNARLNTTTVRFRKNGSNGNMSFTIGAGATGDFEDVTGVDPVTINDEVNIGHTMGAGTENLVTSNIGVTFISRVREIPFICARDIGRAQNFNVTSNYHIAGGLIAVGTEANAQFKPRLDCSIYNLVALVTANTIATSATTVTFRKNGADTPLAVSIAAGATGYFQDVTDVVSVGATDEINYQVITPNTSGALTFRYIATVAKTTDPTPRAFGDSGTMGMVRSFDGTTFKLFG